MVRGQRSRRWPDRMICWRRHAFSSHGRRSRGDVGDKSPKIWSRGTLVQIVSSDVCHIDTKRSVLWPSKYAKIRFRHPAGGSSLRSPRLPSRLERGHLSPYPTPFGTDPPCVPLGIPARSTPMVTALNNVSNNMWRIVTWAHAYAQKNMRTDFHDIQNKVEDLAFIWS